MPHAIPPKPRQERPEIGGKRAAMAGKDDTRAEIFVRLADANATRALGARLAKNSLPGTVILLDGPLGAGKTTLAQGFADGLGSAPAASPSFVVAHSYPGGKMPLWHLDLYRIEDPSAIDDLDLDQYLPLDGVALVEWATRATGPWPKDRVEIVLAIEGEGRSARISGFGRWAPLIRAFESPVRP
jgi:tRNA threonylcarbamoyladenosine biosynthesis protein TsaE